MMNTVNREFSFVEVWFTDQASKALERFRKHVKGYAFLPFARKFGNKYGKKVLDTATKTGVDAAKTVSKTAVQKTAEATGDLIRNKIADKITSIGKLKKKEKRQQIIDDLRLF